MNLDGRAFFQDGPLLPHPFQSDLLLRGYLKRKLPAETLSEVESELNRIGSLASGDWLNWARECEANPPRHIPYDPWGRRIDRIETSDAWSRLEAAAAVEGIVATGYERTYGSLSRLVQFAKLYLYHPSSAIFSCPLAMTDGAARAIELYGDETLKREAYSCLTSRDPSRFWTSGQWMTERTGGSDVSGTATIARREGGGFRLYGDKWFTSATTSQMAMTLARIEGAEAGSRGLSLFYLELRDSAGALKNIRVNRLKDKLGTKALPTAELTLEGTPARLVGGEGGGVRKISSLFNITRIYNSVCAIANSRRALSLAWDYSDRRQAFGKKLIDLPLHLEKLASLEAEFVGSLLLSFFVAELLGRDELGEASESERAMLRLLTPVVKLYTAKRSISTASEVLEAFGGAGYCEDTGLPFLLREAQVFSIWEGTTEVLSLDALRAIEKENAFGPFLAEMRARLGQVASGALDDQNKAVGAAISELETWFGQAVGRDRSYVETHAKDFAWSMARVCGAVLLLEHASWCGHVSAPEREKVAIAARRWCAGPLVRVSSETDRHRENQKLSP